MKPLYKLLKVLVQNDYCLMLLEPRKQNIVYAGLACPDDTLVQFAHLAQNVIKGSHFNH